MANRVLPRATSKLRVREQHAAFQAGLLRLASRCHFWYVWTPCLPRMRLCCEESCSATGWYRLPRRHLSPGFPL